MSYCVNCGVKLEASLDHCPLCNTPVLNPNEITTTRPVSPFPKEKGQVEKVKRKDLAILLSVFLTATSVTTLLANLFLIGQSLWSLYIIGLCVLIWVLCIPAVIYTRLPLVFCLLLDGAAAALYQYLISFNTPNQHWFFGLALPVTGLVTALAMLLCLLIQKVSASFLAIALYLFAELAALCIGVDLLIRRFLELEPGLGWSAIVLTICIIVEVALITILSKSRLRNAVRRRLHF